MLTLVSEQLETYAVNHTQYHDHGELLQKLAEETNRTMDSPMMMSGTTVGNLLNTLVFATNSKRILEIGTFVGYSSLMMAMALPEDGELITCDIDKKSTSLAQKYWNQHPAGQRIDLRLGPAIQTIDSLNPEFDMVFIDADKQNYVAYYEKVLPLLSSSGLIVIDNVLWSGKVLNPIDDDTIAIDKLNKK
ncbi:MAG: methyltransferase, partial [Chloroflexi bacterium]|nr:methyltransferase [Chloroflexota bacterium]